MSNEINLSQARSTEDPLLESAIGRPTIEQHFHIHTKETDSTLKKFWATRDLLYQHHWDTLEIAKNALKFSLIGGSIGTAFYVTHLYDESTYVHRKAFQYAETHTFGHAQIFWKFSKQFFFAGAIAGGAWYVWWNMLWSDHTQQDTLMSYALGYSIYMGGAAGLYHPRYALKGALVGGIVGVIQYCNQNANTNSSKTRIGFTYDLPGFQSSKKDKELQAIKDQIFYLGQVHQITSNNFKEV